ncbi:hypothetical protein Thiosp_03996 [Thiorhodovibrio litoralis]|nr:hypothetical protein Thiosp_03996 [Thiorhodovibrio litoralis]
MPAYVFSPLTRIIIAYCHNLRLFIQTPKQVEPATSGTKYDYFLYRH